MRSKLSLVASLYVSQAIPLGFFLTAMPVILRGAGLSHRQIGLFALVALPWLLKWTWAPVVDRWGSARHGHYRSWILVLQSGSVLSVAVLSMLDVGSSLVVVAAVAALFMLLSATQDVATDAVAVRILARHERGPANGVQVGGYYLGQVLGGGVMLVAFHRFGWTAALLAMAATLALPLWPVWRFREPAKTPTAASAKVGWRDLGGVLRRTGARWVVILLVFRAGEAMAVFVYHQHLVDLGLGLDEIGFVIGVIESTAALCGALVGGWAVRRFGRRGALVALSSVQAFALCGLLLPASGIVSRPLLFAVAGLVAAAGGMATAALYTAMMDAAAERTAGTDFTVQQSLAAVGPMLGAGLSGFLLGAVGYLGLYGCAVALAILTVFLVRGVRLHDAAAGPHLVAPEPA